jgi:pimeloyl-ACP methyl ester carboxylesterase
LASPDVSLETNIADIVGVLEYENLLAVNLVGHSAAGTVIAGVADRQRLRVENVIYLDAVVPESGQSAWELLGPRNRQWFEEMLATTQDKWLLPVPRGENLFGIRDAADASWVKSKLTPQPVRPWREAVLLSGSDDAKRSYIYCDWRGNTYSDTAARVRSDPSWRYRELRTGHDAMITAPAELATVLAELAG